MEQHTPETTTGASHDHDELRAQVAHALDGRTQTDLAHELAVPLQPLNRWLMGKSRASDLITIEPKVRDWLARRAQQPSRSSRGGPSDFVETPTAEHILSALAYAQAQRDMVSICGAPGVGKTYAIRHYQAMYRDVWHVTITPACSSVVPALEEVAEAVGLREVSAGARQLARSISARVRDTRGLLVVDEFQLLGLPALEVFRAIHDAEGLAIALTGNETGYGRMSGSRAAHHAQIYSRLGMRVHIAPPGPRDVAVLAARARVTEPKAIALLERIGSRPGGLRSVHKVITLASFDGAPSFAKLKAAVDNLGADE